MVSARDSEIYRCSYVKRQECIYRYPGKERGRGLSSFCMSTDRAATCSRACTACVNPEVSDSLLLVLRRLRLRALEQPCGERQTADTQWTYLGLKRSFCPAYSAPLLTDERRVALLFLGLPKSSFLCLERDVCPDPY